MVNVRERFRGPFEVYSPYHELEYRAAVMVFFAAFDLPNVTPDSAFHRKRALSKWLTYVELTPTYFTEFFLEGIPPAKYSAFAAEAPPIANASTHIMATTLDRMRLREVSSFRICVSMYPPGLDEGKVSSRRRSDWICDQIVTIELPADVRPHCLIPSVTMGYTQTRHPATATSPLFHKVGFDVLAHVSARV